MALVSGTTTTTATMSPPPPGCPLVFSAPLHHLTYLNIVQNTTVMCLQLMSITLLSAIFVAYYLAPQRFAAAPIATGGGGGLSYTMRIFLGTHLANCVLSLPFFVYLVTLWHSPYWVRLSGEPLYDPRLVFALGNATQAYLVTAPVATLFLQLDRLLILRLAHR